MKDASGRLSLAVAFLTVTVLVAGTLVGAGFDTRRASSALEYKLVDLGTIAHSASTKPGIGSTRDIAINSSGDITGYTITDAAGDSQMFLLRSGVSETITPPSSRFRSEQPVALNDSDQVLVRLTLAANSNQVPAVAAWSPSGTNWLLLPHLDPKVTAVSINSSGDVAGTDGRNAVEWSPAPGGYAETQLQVGAVPAAIDNGGWIAGTLPYGNLPGSSQVVVISGPGASDVSLGAPRPTVTNDGCTTTVTEAPQAATDVQLVDAEVVVSVVGNILHSQKCPGLTTNEQSAAWWQVDFLRGQFRQHYLPITIPAPSSSCPKVLATTVTSPCDNATGVTSDGWIVGTHGGKAGIVFLSRNGRTENVEMYLSASQKQVWKVAPEFGLKPTINAQDAILTTAVGAHGTVHSVELMVVQPPPAQPQIFHNSFDSQAVGPVAYGSDINDWGGVKAPSNVTVENTYVHSDPNAAEITLNGAASAYVYKVYKQTYPVHDLSFAMALGNDIVIPTNSYLAFASTETASVKPGLVELILQNDLTVAVTYVDGNGVQQSIYTGFKMQPGGQYIVDLNEVAGDGTGSLTLNISSADGRHYSATASNLDLGTIGVGLFNVGNVYSPSPGATGHIFVDNVVTNST